MDAAIYFPILRGKHGEIDALGHLSPLAKTRIRPVVDVPPKKSADIRNLDTYIAEFLMSIKTAYGTLYPFYIDLSQFAPDLTIDDGRHPAELLFEVTSIFRMNAIPVTGPESIRGPGLRYLNAIHSVSAQFGLNPAIRLPIGVFSTPKSIRAELGKIIEAQDLESSATDVILDAESLYLVLPADADHSRLVETLSETLIQISDLGLRSVIWVGSSIPEKVGPEFNDKPLRVDRRELRVWRELIARPENPLVLFGDYGVVWPFQSDSSKPVRPPSRVRLSTGSEHVFYRGDRADHRALCQEVREDPAFYGQQPSWGMSFTRSCGSGGSGVGSPTDWVARDTNMHIETTVVSVERDLGSVNRLGVLRLAKPKTEPWLQTMLENVD